MPRGIDVSRRTVLIGLCAGPMIADPAVADILEDAPGSRLRPWRFGFLDIHHIATGRGNAALIVAPDGTTILIDAGAMYDGPPYQLPSLPADTRRPGEWIARYVARRLRETGGPAIDYLLATHFHPDHIGAMHADLPPSGKGDYRLTGIADVVEALPVGKIVDRGFPDYDRLKLSQADFFRNYVAMVAARQRAGGAVEAFRCGAADQVVMRRPHAGGADCDIRILAAGGMVWTGRGDGAVSWVPSLGGLAAGDRPDENMLSAALRLRYGEFSYFNGGDVTANTFYGTQAWRDIAGRAAAVCGPVDVAVVPHHGLYDGLSQRAARALRPRIWLIDAWHVSHPSMAILDMLFSERLYPGPRDVFASGLSPENALVCARLAKRLSSAAGHMIVRVAPGGRSYRVVITDNRDEGDRVIKTCGPYRCVAA